MCQGGQSFETSVYIIYVCVVINWNCCIIYGAYVILYTTVAFKWNFIQGPIHCHIFEDSFHVFVYIQLKYNPIYQWI